jgi:hypothetical protein
MRYAIPIMLLLSGCVAGGPPDHPLTATWQGAKTLELSPAGYRFGDEFGSWSVDKQTLRLARNDPGGQPVRKVEERPSPHGERLSARRPLYAGRITTCRSGGVPYPQGRLLTQVDIGRTSSHHRACGDQCLLRCKFAVLSSKHAERILADLSSLS